MIICNIITNILLAVVTQVDAKYSMHNMVDSFVGHGHETKYGHGHDPMAKSIDALLKRALKALSPNYCNMGETTVGKSAQHLMPARTGLKSLPSIFHQRPIFGGFTSPCLDHPMVWAGAQGEMDKGQLAFAGKYSNHSSPCNRICRYKKDFYNAQVCIGCFREAFEIKNWASFTDDEKRFVLMDCADRRVEWETQSPT